MEKDAGLYVAVTCRFRSRLYQPFARQNPAGQVAPFGYRCNGGQVGIYGACYKVSIIMTLFVQTFRYAADPFFFNESAQVGARQLYADVLTLL